MNRSISNLAGVQVGGESPVRVMGVINVSPESFYKGSVSTGEKALLKTVERMEKEGADFLDIGAMSSAPYLKTEISVEEEARRLAWAVPLIKKYTKLPISADTPRAVPAKAALNAGADILNDISGLLMDPAMAPLVKKFRGTVLMAHPAGFRDAWRGSEKLEPVKAVKKILQRSLHLAVSSGTPLSRIAIDPGIGFFRTVGWEWWQWDVSVLNNLQKLQSWGVPVLVGISRKSFIGKLLNGRPVEERLYGSLAATAIAVAKGASIIRTHDVAATKEAVQVAGSILSGA